MSDEHDIRKNQERAGTLRAQLVVVNLTHDAIGRIAAEYPRLREGLVLFTYLHLAADAALTRALVESRTRRAPLDRVKRALLAFERLDAGWQRLEFALIPVGELLPRLGTGGWGLGTRAGG